MIYVCIPSHNEGPTVGLLLWKIRQVFTEFSREYQLVVADDGSTDATAEVLAPSARVLPLTVLSHRERQGYAATVEELLRFALQRTDRPKRDCAILMHADFAHDAASLPSLVKRIESGADVVVAQGSLTGEPSLARRLVRRWGPQRLRGRAPLHAGPNPAIDGELRERHRGRAQGDHPRRRAHAGVQPHVRPLRHDRPLGSV
jgi:glycosyltransferase involved in cell wall biosynthesis